MRVEFSAQYLERWNGKRQSFPASGPEHSKRIAAGAYCRPLVPPRHHERTAELSGRRIFLKRHCDRTLGERATRLAGRLSWRKVRACPGWLRALSVSHGQSSVDGALCVSVTGA